MQAPTIKATSLDGDEEYTVIIDIGQGTTKVGFAGDEKPKAIFPTVTGKPKYKNMMAGVNVQDIYVGDDTTRMRGVLKLAYPINRGNVMDWEQYFAILNHIFQNVLRVDSSKCHVIYLVPPLTPPDTAIYFARVLFETHRCKSVAILDTASTAVFSVGETTALSVELGTGLTHVTPIMNGQLYNPSIQRLNLAGIDIEEYLEKLLTQYGIFQKKEIIKEIKEKACRILEDPQDNMNPAYDYDFVLPDGESLKISAYVATMAGECLFDPNLLGYNSYSLPQAIINSLRVVDPYYWRPLLKKIVFSGGTSFFKGLKARLEKEVELLLPQLGPLPDPVEDQSEQKDSAPQSTGPKKLVQITTKTKNIENCPKCGELVDLSESKFCPFCGAKLEADQIEIIGAAKQKYPDRCPNCKIKLDGDSAFCPECGTKLEPIIIEDSKLDRKEKKILKKTAAEKEEIMKIAEEIVDEYGTEEDLEELEKIEEEISANSKEDEEVDDPNKIVRVILSDNRDIASFRGASILGALPSFKRFMVDYQAYQQNPQSVLVDFSRIVNQ